MSERDAAVLIRDAARRTAVTDELHRQGHRVRVLEDPNRLLAASASASLLIVGVEGAPDVELVKTVRSVPGGDDAVIVAIVTVGAPDVTSLLRAGASDVWVLPSGGSVPDVRVRLMLAEHYARLQVEHTRVGGELSVLKRALDLTGTGFVLTDPQLEDNPIVYANRSFQEVTGYPLEETLGRNCRFLQADERDQDEVRELADAIAAQRPASVTLRNTRRDGSVFINEVHIAPVRDDEGRVVRFVGVQIDVTDQQESGARLAIEQQARRHAERERRRTAIVAAGTASMDRAESPEAVLRALRAAVADLLGPLTGVDVNPQDAERDARTWPIVTVTGDAPASLVLEADVDDGDDRSAVDLLVERTDEALLRVSRRLQERGLVRALRESLEPLRPVAVAGLDVEARVVPAGPGLAVGGDFIDNVRFADGSIGVVLGDVTGQGPRAAAINGLVRHTVRACARMSGSPAEALRHVNDLLLDIPDRRRYSAVTLLQVGAAGDADALGVTVALAGSPPPVCAPRDRDACRVGTPGTLLGATATPRFTDTMVELRPGDALVCFTDGLTEPLGGGTEASDTLAAGLSGAARDAAGLADAALAVGERGDTTRPDDRAVLALVRPGPA